VRVLIDFSQIPLARTGVGVYAENLVREIVSLASDSDLLFVLIQSDDAVIRELASKHPRVRVLVIPARIFRNRAALLVFEQLLLPFVLVLRRIDVIHSLHYTHPLLSPSRRVVTIHDLTFLLFPHLHTRARRLTFPFFIRRAMRHVEALIFVSQSTCNDAARLMPGGKGLRAVVPLGVDPACFAPISADRICSTRKRLGLSEPFILNVGTIEPRKNLSGLIQAFEQAADLYSRLTLVLAGKLGWDYDDVLRNIDASRHASRIRRIGFVSDDDKLALLNACELFIYPSLYEGFGLPVLEAMAAGAPVITSNNSSLGEVAGNAAELVDPGSDASIGSTLLRLLADNERRTALREMGRSRAAHFTWAATAQMTWNVYSDLMKSRKNLSHA